MQVLDITMRHYMSHDATSVDFPDTGVVLITGENGAGKSSFPEAVSFAFWGKTLRRTNPWQDGKSCSVAVAAAGVTAKRSRTAKGSTTRLQFTVAGEKPKKFERTKEAQAELETHVGPWDVWRRTHAFSTQDASHFTLATDAERKKLVESVLFGSNRFDAGLAACRNDLKAARKEADRLDRLLAQKQLRKEAAMQRAEEARTLLKTLPEEHEEAGETGALRKEIKELHAFVAEVDQDICALATKDGEARDELAALDARLAEAEARVQRLAADTCPVCAQDIPPELKEALQADLQQTRESTRAQKAEAEAARERRAAAKQDLYAEQVEPRERARALTQQIQAIEAAAKAAQKTQAARAQARQTQEEAEQDAETLNGDIVNTKQLLLAAQVEVHTLEAVEQVLGVRGVRAHVLGEALRGIEAVANYWLAKVAGEGLELTLDPYSEKASGGVSDAIALKVAGAGGGFGYKAASGGERRRIDIALLLALAEVSQAASGRDGQGTLFFDEVFDALDGEGAGAVCAALAELAQTRCVVVISHSSTLVETLQPTLRLHVKGGRVTTG